MMAPLLAPLGLRLNEWKCMWNGILIAWSKKLLFDISTYLAPIFETEPWMLEVVVLYLFSLAQSFHMHSLARWELFVRPVLYFCTVWTAATVLIVAGHICVYQPPPWHHVRLEGGQAQTEHVNASRKVELPDYFHFFSFLLNRSNWNPASLILFQKKRVCWEQFLFSSLTTKTPSFPLWGSSAIIAEVEWGLEKTKVVIKGKHI